MAKAVCRILGSIFLVIGLIVIFRNAPVDKYHNALHLVTGVIALVVGFAGSTSAARAYCLGFGAFYLVFGLLGMVMGDREAFYMWHIGPMHLNMGDHLFHVVLGPFLLMSGLPTKRAARRSELV